MKIWTTPVESSYRTTNEIYEHVLKLTHHPCELDVTFQLSFSPVWLELQCDNLCRQCHHWMIVDLRCFRMKELPLEDFTDGSVPRDVVDFWLWDIVLGSFLCNFSFRWFVTLWSWITNLMVSISSSHWPWVWLVVWDLLRASAINRSLPSIYLKWRSHPVIRHSILWSRMRFSAPGRLSIAASGLWSSIYLLLPAFHR